MTGLSVAGLKELSALGLGSLLQWAKTGTGILLTAWIGQRWQLEDGSWNFYSSTSFLQLFHPIPFTELERV